MRGEVIRERKISFLFLPPRGRQRNSPIIGGFSGVLLRSDFLAVDFRMQTGAPEALFAGQNDGNEMKRRIADIGEAIFAVNGQMRRVAGDEVDGERFSLDLIAGGEGHSAAGKQKDQGYRDNSGRHGTAATPERANQGRRILPGQRSRV